MTGSREQWKKKKIHYVALLLLIKTNLSEKNNYSLKPKEYALHQKDRELQIKGSYMHLASAEANE